MILKNTSFFKKFGLDVTIMTQSTQSQFLLENFSERQLTRIANFGVSMTFGLGVK